MDRKRVLQDYDLDEIYQVLYHSNIPKTLWKSDRYETKRLFVNHSVGDLKMFCIPLIWIPIVKKLMLELVKIDPNIHFFQVKERAGELRILTSPSYIHESLIQQILFGARKAIDTITLVQLKLKDKIKYDTS